VERAVERVREMVEPVREVVASAWDNLVGQLARISV